MASNLDATLKRHNGTDVDTIYPTTTWTQVESKPTTFTPTAHTHGDIADGGTISTAVVTPANTDTLLIADASNSNKIQRAITIGTGTTTFLRNDGTWAAPTDVDTNWYPTAFTWTGGTTAGPTGSLTGTGMSAVSFGAIPSASGTASGVVNTNAQTFAGVKTFSSSPSAPDYYVDDNDLYVGDYISDMLISGVPEAEKSKWGLNYNPSTRTFILTLSSGSYVYIKGNKYTVNAGVYNWPAHAATTGVYYFYYDNTGTAVTSATAWDILETAPVAYVVYNSANDGGAAAGILSYELHGATMSTVTHKYNHLTSGTQLVSGGTISGYTLNTSTAAAISWATTEAQIVDEDIFLTVPAQAESNYNLGYFSATNEFNWRVSATIPIITNGTNIMYNPVGGGLVAITDTNKYVNYYTIFTNANTAAQRIFIIPGQAIYTSLALAKAETPANLNLSYIPFKEYVFAYRITYKTNASGLAEAGKAEIADTPSQLNLNTATISMTAYDHQLLTNRTAADAHPISSITDLQTTLDGKLTAASTLDASKLSGTIPAAVLQTEWDTAYTHSQVTTGAVHGATTVGNNLFRLTDPGAITFLRVNADNTVTALSDANFRTAIGAAATSHAHGNISNTGTMSDTAAAAATGDSIVVRSVGSNVLESTTITFDTTVTNTYLRRDGTWVAPPGTYTLPLATTTTIGGVGVGYTSTETNLALSLSGNDAYVSLPRQIPAVTLNGSSSTAPSIYAPTTSGTAWQKLRSGGTGVAPSWVESVYDEGISSLVASGVTASVAFTSGQRSFLVRILKTSVTTTETIGQFIITMNDAYNLGTTSWGYSHRLVWFDGTSTWGNTIEYYYSSTTLYLRHNAGVNMAFRVFAL